MNVRYNSLVDVKIPFSNCAYVSTVSMECLIYVRSWASVSHFRFPSTVVEDVHWDFHEQAVSTWSDVWYNWWNDVDLMFEFVYAGVYIYFTPVEGLASFSRVYILSLKSLLPMYFIYVIR